MNRTTWSLLLLCAADTAACRRYYPAPYYPQPVNAQITIAAPPPQPMPPPPPPPPPPQQQFIVQAQVTVPQGVIVMQPNCQPGAPEQCNGIDDNCNGQIDEGCGYQSGQIQVTAAWNTQSDIDLHVTDPNGEEIFYAHRNSSSGGVLDHDANAACTPSPPTVENVYWSTPTPPRGSYVAQVRAYAMCGAYQTPVTLSIAVGGRVLGTYQYTLGNQGDQFTVPFNVN